MFSIYSITVWYFINFADVLLTSYEAEIPNKHIYGDFKLKKTFGLYDLYKNNSALVQVLPVLNLKIKSFLCKKM